MAVNWDKLNVGRIDLDHSEGFFDKRHLEHERLEDLLQGNLFLFCCLLPKNLLCHSHRKINDCQGKE